jgi:hypothetical protein
MACVSSAWWIPDQNWSHKPCSSYWLAPAYSLAA